MSNSGQEQIHGEREAKRGEPLSDGSAKTKGSSRRRFLQGAAMVGAASVTSYSTKAAPALAQSSRTKEASADSVAMQAKTANLLVANFEGGYGNGDVPEFQVPKRPMGKTGLQVSILGMGGYHLGTVDDQSEVTDMVAKALDHGINFFDNAWEYHKGVSEELVGAALKGKRDQAIVMTKVCTHGRKTWRCACWRSR
jgi:hypothetical protein